MVHMSQQLDFSKSAFCINPVIKCIPNLLDCNLFTSLRIERRASHTKQPDHYMNFNVSSHSFNTRIKFSGQNRINISFIRIEKSPFSQWRRNSKVNTSSGSHRKNQTREDRKQAKKKIHWYEQKCQSHTCSGTINSSMYDNDLTITTSPLTSSAPYSG